VPGVKGCVVANAHPELRAFAEAEVAKGQADHICQASCDLRHARVGGREE